MTIAVFRQLLLVLPLSFLFSRIGGLDLVWWAFPIAEVLAGLLAGIYLWRTYQKVIRPLAEDGYKF
jgi:Na+-driven multidrug efflux pump